MAEPRRTYENVEDVIAYQMSRRRALGMGAGAVAGVLFGGGLLSACTGEGGETYSGNGNRQPGSADVVIGEANIPTPRDKTVIIGQVDFQVFNSFNTRIPNGNQGGSGFEAICREYMFYLNLPTGELIPWLAEKYEYNDDFTALTFTFNANAKWSDGKPLTSRDFRFTVLLMRDNPNLIGGGGDLKTFVKEVRTPDDQTAIIELTQPNPRFHYGFICTIVTGFDILPEHIWKGQDPTKFKDAPPVRSGPYVLDQAIGAQKMFVWKKNSNYWNKAALDPAPEFVIYQSIAESLDAASQAFRRAEFDVTSQTFEAHAEAMRNEGYPNLITTPFHDPCPRGLWVNSDPSRGIVSDPRMHWVLSYLVDREKIGNTVWPVQSPPAQYPWADYDGNDKWEISAIADKYPLAYDPARAEQLLDEMGATKNADGQRMWKGEPARVQIITPTPVDDPVYIIGQLVSDELKKLGVNASIRSLSGSVFSEKVERGEFDVRSEWICSVSWDPNQLYSGLKSEYAKPVGVNASGKNTVRFRNAELDRIATQLDNMDPQSAEAKPLLEQAMEVYYENLPCIPVIQTTYPAYYNTTFWTGWPTADNLYQPTNDWWGHFIFILNELKPTGQK